MRRAPAASRIRFGIALAVVYAAVAVVYVRLGDNPRPLFDGFAPVPPYNWVNPPQEFRAGNVVPRPASLDVPIGLEGSPVTSGSSGDGQVVLSFPAGALLPHPPDIKVTVQITPLDPAVLAPPPSGLAADGNAYRIDLTYEPSKETAATLAAEADIFLVVPEPAQTLLFSPDGNTWGNLPFRPVPDPTQIGGAFTGPGYFLAVAPPVGRPSDAGTAESEGSRMAKAAAATVVLAVVLAGAPLAWRRVRGRGPTAEGAA